MNRKLLLLVAGAAVAVGIVYGLRVSQKTSNAAVTSLLPRETVAFAHVPDFNRTRDDWHRSDIYQLYTEPAVQDFLRKPLARVPRTYSFSHTLQSFAELDAKDGFVAVTSLANENDPKIVAGFRFRGSQENAEKVIGRWRSRLLGSVPRQTLDYQQHKIETVSTGPWPMATAYDGQWFFVSSGIEELKAMLDRADGRVQDRQLLLAADETFRGAMAQMPASYAACLYVQPKMLADKLAALRGRSAAAGQGALLEQVRCLCATTRFENGKMHDVLFLEMPKQEQETELTRSSLALATRDTFIYGASLLNLSKQFALLDPSAGANFLGASLQKAGRALAAAGMTPEEWKATFGSELGVLADWPQDVHWPTLLAAWPVKDPARARKAAVVLARNLDDDGAWTEKDKDGVHYISTPYTTGLLTIRPTVAVSDRMMVAGLDSAAVEAAMQRAASGASQLSDSPAYKHAVGAVPSPTHFFAYVDPGLLYARLDATLRPMLLMSAAFMPWMSDYLDAGKLPSPEIVTKHLSPIVSSTVYKHDGYLAESVGPITLNQAGLSGIVLAVGFGAWRQQLSAPGWNAFGLPSGGSASPSAAVPGVTPAASASPSGTP